MGGDRTDRSGLRARCKHGRLRLGKSAGKARPRNVPSGASQGGKCCVVMGVDRTDRSGLRARCKHGRLRLGKGEEKARPRTAPSGASQGGKCCVVWSPVGIVRQTAGSVCV
ncbi:hypothetical protein NDU88_001430 [Pleurodeles waltl]|uniref:Uncharacterized protein n=1 Tax=Pleurodeles waltl TaxID=8319 RepID=A0AAV7Q3Z6_PLEWA|nr:hypothetical protein NDU88_001430 [Pleurodeles waltl]